MFPPCDEGLSLIIVMLKFLAVISPAFFFAEGWTIFTNMCLEAAFGINLEVVLGLLVEAG